MDKDLLIGAYQNDRYSYLDYLQWPNLSMCPSFLQGLDVFGLVGVMSR